MEGSRIPDGSAAKRTAGETVAEENLADELHKRTRVGSFSEDAEHPNNLLTYLLKGNWLGQTMLIDIHTGQVTSRYLTYSLHGIKGNRFSRLTKRLYLDERTEASFFSGVFDPEFSEAVCTTPGVEWKMKQCSENMVVISAIVDLNNLPANSVLSDALITRLTDGIYIHTRQIIVGEAVQMESTRTRRLSGENTYLESQEDAPELDLTHLDIYLDRLREFQDKANAIKSSAILIYPGATRRSVEQEEPDVDGQANATETEPQKDVKTEG